MRLKAFLLTCLLILGAAPAMAAPKTASRLVIVISIDAFRADYLTRGVTPTLTMLAKTGAHASAMRPSFPSLTYPNHYTLMTGLRPDHHGVVNNNMSDAAISPLKFTMSAKIAEDPRWWEGATPLWVTAQKAGRIVASGGWPGTEGLIHDSRPNYLDPWRENRDPREIVAVALNWLDLTAAYRPSLELLYFEQADHAGHDFGPNSPELTAALRQIDAALARLVAGLKARHLFDSTDIVLVSDHGMAQTDASRVMVIDDPADTVTAVATGAVAGIDPLPGHEAQAAALLGRREHGDCWKKQDVPPQFHYGSNFRVPAIVCLADEGWMFRTRAQVEKDAKDKKNLPGSHGFDPALPSMQALFVAHGPDFRRGVTLPAFDNVSVYPLLARITGLKGEANDGRLEDLAGALK